MSAHKKHLLDRVTEFYLRICLRKLIRMYRKAPFEIKREGVRMTASGYDGPSSYRFGAAHYRIKQINWLVVGYGLDRAAHYMNQVLRRRNPSFVVTKTADPELPMKEAVHMLVLKVLIPTPA